MQKLSLPQQKSVTGGIWVTYKSASYSQAYGNIVETVTITSRYFIN